MGEGRVRSKMDIQHLITFEPMRHWDLKVWLAIAFGLLALIFESYLARIPRKPIAKQPEQTSNSRGDKTEKPEYVNPKIKSRYGILVQLKSVGEWYQLCPLRKFSHTSDIKLEHESRDMVNNPLEESLKGIPRRSSHVPKSSTEVVNAQPKKHIQ
jgi:hypothetical protein